MRVSRIICQGFVMEQDMLLHDCPVQPDKEGTVTLPEPPKGKFWKVEYGDSDYWLELVDSPDDRIY